MARLGKYDVHVRDDSRLRTFRFEYVVHVSAKGLFYTNLDENIVAQFNRAGVFFFQNKRLGRDCYMFANTLEDLQKALKNKALKVVSKNLVGESIILKYQIQTQSSYWIVKGSGEMVPNGYWDKDRGGHYTDPDYYSGWVDDTVGSYAATPTPTGMQVYVQPYWKRIYEFSDGKRQEELSLYSHHLGSDDGTSLAFLGSLSAMGEVSGAPMREIEYNEDVGSFFERIIRFIWMVNHKLKDFIEPTMIQESAKNRQLFLTQ